MLKKWETNMTIHIVKLLSHMLSVRRGHHHEEQLQLFTLVAPMLTKVHGDSNLCMPSISIQGCMDQKRNLGRTKD